MHKNFIFMRKVFQIFFTCEIAKTFTPIATNNVTIDDHWPPFLSARRIEAATVALVRSKLASQN